MLEMNCKTVDMIKISKIISCLQEAEGKMMFPLSQNTCNRAHSMQMEEENIIS